MIRESDTSHPTPRRKCRGLVSLDTGTPVVEDYVNKMPFKFTGTLKKAVIELGKSGLGFNDEKKLKEMVDTAARAVE